MRRRCIPATLPQTRLESSIAVGECRLALLGYALKLMRSFGRLAFCLLMLGVAGCDQATKHLAVTRLPNRGVRELLPGVLDLRAAMNTDTAFSLLGGIVPLQIRIVLLLVLAVAGALALAVFIHLRWRDTTLFERAAGALVLGGAVGNALDRMTRSYVVDFIHVHYWPTFNVADIAISVGVGLFLVGSFLRRRRTVMRT
jgi:signal peptidase II